MNSSIKSNKGSYRPEIDGLRAIAVAAVILYHFNDRFLPSGFLGVDIFFVISGYVITSSLANRQYKGFKEYILGFYERRVKRIIPPLIFYVVVFILLISLFNPDPSIHYRTAISSLFGLSNNYLFIISNNYFSGATQFNPFAQTWSLGVEEQFYLLFPLLVWFTGFAKKSKNGPRNLFLLLAFCSAISLLGFIHYNFINQNAAYYLSPFRFWELAAGSLAFILEVKYSALYSKINNLDPIRLLIPILIIFFIPKNLIVISTISVVLLTIGLIISLKSNNIVFNFLTNKRVLYIGLISYSLYLWHWGVLVISRWTLGDSLWLIPLQLLLIYLLADFSYKYIEQPIRFSKLLGKSHLNILLGISTIISSSFGLTYAFIRSPHLTVLDKIEPLNKRFYLGSNEMDFIGFNPSSEFIKATYMECVKQEFLSTCATPAKNKNLQTILLFGDSHAGHMVPLLGAIHNDYGFGINVSATGIYPTKNITHEYGHTLQVSSKLTKGINSKFNSQLDLLKKNDIVFLVSRLDFHFVEPILDKVSPKINHYSDDFMPVTVGESLEEWTAKLSTTATRLEKLKLNLIVLAPIPIFTGVDNAPPHFVCVKEWYRPFKYNKCNVYKENKKFLKSRTNAIDTNLQKLSNKHKNLHIYNIFDQLCPNEDCVNRVGDKLIYTDTNHISHDVAYGLNDHFIEFLIRNDIIKKDNN
ncbi:acyltransferase family protein [Prochlorococcus sp. SS52]|uniref:acyltransferase family protein n=1 Tax=Prochlorococcus sp. SS52 TaxID=1499501 RepID=UPI0039A669F7